jgi:hypothetical protein
MNLFWLLSLSSYLRIQASDRVVEKESVDQPALIVPVVINVKCSGIDKQLFHSPSGGILAARTLENSYNAVHSIDSSDVNDIKFLRDVSFIGPPTATKTTVLRKGVPCLGCHRTVEWIGQAYCSKKENCNLACPILTNEYFDSDTASVRSDDSTTASGKLHQWESMFIEGLIQNDYDNFHLIKECSIQMVRQCDDNNIIQSRTGATW